MRSAEDVVSDPGATGAARPRMIISVTVLLVAGAILSTISWVTTVARVFAFYESSGLGVTAQLIYLVVSTSPSVIALLVAWRVWLRSRYGVIFVVFCAVLSLFIALTVGMRNPFGLAACLAFAVAAVLLFLPPSRRFANPPLTPVWVEPAATPGVERRPEPTFAILSMTFSGMGVLFSLALFVVRTIRPGEYLGFIGLGVAGVTLAVVSLARRSRGTWLATSGIGIAACILIPILLTTGKLVVH